MKFGYQAEVKSGLETLHRHRFMEKVQELEVLVANKHDTHSYQIFVTEKGRRISITVMENGKKVKTLVTDRL